MTSYRCSTGRWPADTRWRVDKLWRMAEALLVTPGREVHDEGSAATITAQEGGMDAGQEQ